MKSELIVDVQAQEVSIALLEEGRLVSLQKESTNQAYAVGDIYLAKVKKLMPGLNAAFINVGYEKDAFLHYLDLGPTFGSYSEFLTQLLNKKNNARTPASRQVSAMKLAPDIDKHGAIANALTPGQELLVQIVKEPISSKGPRLTTEISLTGRYLVLTPFCDKISISQKIKSSEEKQRLRRLIESIKPRNFGVIIRTSAEGKKSAELDSELHALLQAFDDACAKARTAECPALVFEEENRVVGMLRDVFSPAFESIHVNDPDIYEQIVRYVRFIAPDRTDIVKLYKKEAPIFDNFNITRQIKSSFGKTVSFKSGAYIIIEHTEALHVIDVNSGNRTKAGTDQESNALEVNLRAAEEIARQLRLRDMGGIIVVDFIDMAKGEHRQQLYEHMRTLMVNDRARHNILPLSKFGLMQITRQRVRPALDITTNETCPSCHGRGEVQPSILFTDTLFEKLDYIVNTLQLKGCTMYVHPYVEAYLKKGLFTSIYGKWRRQLGRNFKIVADESIAYLQYKVVDKNRNVLNLVAEKDNGQSSAAKTASKRRRGDDDEAPEAPKEVEKEKEVKEPKKEKKAQPKKAKEPKEAKASETKTTEAKAPEAKPEAQLPAIAQEATATPDAQPAPETVPASDSPAETTPAPKKRRRRRKPKTSGESTPADAPQPTE